MQFSDEDRSTLLTWTRSPSPLVQAGLARRARIVLADGARLRDRYRAGGVAALTDATRSGRPVVKDEALIAARTLEPPRSRLGMTNWLSRLLVGEIVVSDFTIAKT